MEQRFTEHQRQKLTKMGFQNMSGTNVVKYGEGNYSKKFGNIWLTLQIRGHIIKRFAFSLPYQGTDFDFMFKCADDLKEGLNFIKSLGYFE